jgi:predicted transcriptional regulator
MPYQFPPDLQHLVDAQMSTGRYRSQDQLIERALRTLDNYDQSVAEIEEGLADEAAGWTRPLAEISNEIRQRHGFAL